MTQREWARDVHKQPSTANEQLTMHPPHMSVRAYATITGSSSTTLDMYLSFCYYRQLTDTCDMPARHVSTTASTTVCCRTRASVTWGDEEMTLNRNMIR